MAAGGPLSTVRPSPTTLHAMHMAPWVAGNICRSPTAEAVFRSVVERKGLADQFDIDSCGTGGGAASWYKAGGYSYHEGDPADARMMKAGEDGLQLSTACASIWQPGMGLCPPHTNSKLGRAGWIREPVYAHTPYSACSPMKPSAR
jgi:hypothetical protein